MAPTPSVEQLEATLQELEISTEYIDTANALSFMLVLNYQDMERAHALATEALHLCTAQFSDYKKGHAEALINLAMYHGNKPNFQEALRLILQAGTIGNALEDTDVRFKQMRILRFIYALMEDYSAAIEASIARVKLAQEAHNPHEEMRGLESLAYDCYRINEHSQALAYSEKSYALADRLGDEAMRAYNQKNRTYPLRDLGLYDQALEHAQQAYSFYKGQSSRDEAVTLGILGYIHLELEEYERAMAYFQQELEIVKDLDSDYLLAYNQCEIGMVHLATGRTDEAIQWLEDGIQLAESRDLKSTLLDNYPHLVEAYKANQNYAQALAVFEKLAELRSEVNSTKAINHRNALLVVHETEQAQLEAKLQQERAEMLHSQVDDLSYQNAQFQKIDAIKNQLAATASHDLRSPLGTIGLDLYLLQQTTMDNTKAQVYVQRMQSQVEYVDEIISDLLDFSKIEELMSPELASHDIIALIRETLTRFETLRKSKAIRLNQFLPLGPICAMLDAHRFARVLDNLISNAIKYTDAGGEMTVSLLPTSEKIVLTISDTGRGIPADEVSRVFDPLFRASNSHGEQGQGHGLSIVKRIVEEHQGEIVCESTLKVGTVFTIRLPRA